MLNGKTYNLVDDQPRTIAAHKSELKHEGAFVETVDSTKNLEAKLADRNYHLIVSDLKREGDPQAGLEYLKKIQNRDDLPPRLIFAPASLVSPVQIEIDKLRRDSKGPFLGAVTSGEEFFIKVFETLSSDSSAS
jgi:DNA-binding NtrC family response regulator